jgi:hypothetical protein
VLEMWRRLCTCLALDTGPMGVETFFMEDLA